MKTDPQPHVYSLTEEEIKAELARLEQERAQLEQWRQELEAERERYRSAAGEP